MHRKTPLGQKGRGHQPIKLRLCYCQWGIHLDPKMCMHIGEGLGPIRCAKWNKNFGQWETKTQMNFPKCFKSLLWDTPQWWGWLHSHSSFVCILLLCLCLRQTDNIAKCTVFLTINSVPDFTDFACFKYSCLQQGVRIKAVQLVVPSWSSG